MASKVPNIIVGDLETGGFVYHQHGITEIAFICVNTITLEEVGRFHAIVAPYKHKNGSMVEYTEQALAVTGMTMKKINAGEDAKEVAVRLKTWCKEMSTGGVNGKPVIAGHNFFKFDKPFIDYFMWLHGCAKIKKQELHKSKNETFELVKFTDLPYQDYVEDSLFWTRWKYANTDIPNNKLATACEYTGVVLFDAHSAMNDTEGNMKMMVEYIKSMRGSGEKREETRFRDEFKFD